MASEQRKYKCWCGSEDFETDSDGVSTCIRCGSKFVIEDGCSKFQIQPEIDEREFLRSAWIRLAQEDAPLDIFDHGCGFKTVGLFGYQAMTDSVSARIHYQASIGYDRGGGSDETRTRGEAESSADAENAYNGKLAGSTDRAVAKDKVVTDWKPFSSEYYAKSSVCLRNGNQIYFGMSFPGLCENNVAGGGFESGLSGDEDKTDGSLVYFNPGIFKENLEKASKDAFAAPRRADRELMKMDLSSEREADELHRGELEASLNSSVPGDRHKDLSYSAEITENSTQLFLVPEYYATIDYAGKSYTIKSLPFGDRPMCGGEIENENGLKARRAEKAEELAIEKEKIGDRYSEEKWQKSKTLLTVTNILLVVSVVALLIVGIVSIAFYVGHRLSGYPVSLFVLLMVFAVIFVVALALFIYSWTTVGKKEKEIESERRRELDLKEASMKSDKEEFTKKYKAEQLDRLNKRLKSLHLRQATADEISKDESEEV